MKRSQEPELMDDPAFAVDARKEFHAELARLNRGLGNNKLILERLRGKRPQRVLDIGCGEGALLAEIRDTLGAQVIGVDLYADPAHTYGVEIIAGDATSIPLPHSDVAISLLTIHHLTEEQIVALVKNVGRSSKRFLIVDLVRHPLPLALFSIFLRPFLNPLVLLDGQQSIRRAYTPDELRALVVEGLTGTDAIFEQWVSPIYGKQVIDISYRN